MTDTAALELDRVRAVARLGLELAELPEPTALPASAVRKAAELVGDTAALWVRDAADRITLQAYWHPEPRARAAMERVSAELSDREDDGDLLEQVWHASSVLCLTREQAVAALPRMHPAYRAYFAEFGSEGMLLLPLRVAGMTVGVLGVSRDLGRDGYGPADQAFVTQVGAIVAVALHNARLHGQLRDELQWRTRAQLDAQHLARHDPLTGLANRRGLVEALQQMQRDARPGALLLLDLDDFKHVNDTFGHDVGDAALVDVGARLRWAVGQLPLDEAQDLLLARLGGDEFAMLVPLALGPAQVARIAQLVMEAVAGGGPSAGGGASAQLPVLLRASVGVARRPEDAGDARGLLRMADIAMYRAKQTGAGWAAYDRDCDHDAPTWVHRAQELKAALDADGVEVHFQPLVTTRPGRLSRVEALARWRQPDGRLVLPGSVVPVAREAELASRLTDLMLRRTLAQLRRWQLRGLEVRAGVKVPGGVLADRAFAGRMTALLAEHELAPSGLVLELPESDVVVSGVAAAVARVRAAGVGVAIDEMGTGVMPLRGLLELTVTGIKIDGSVVRRVEQERYRKVIGALTSGCHALDLAVTASGVETVRQSRLLQEQGVDTLQGYLYARPLPPAVATAWLTAQAAGFARRAARSG